MPRAAPRWPLLLLLLLLLLLPPPLAHGAPARPGGRRPASALVVPKRLQSIAGEVALHLSAFGRDLELRLEPDDSFLAPEFKIARLGGSSGAAGSERELRGCIFSGTVNRDPASLAAVSLCRGLSGTFLLEGQEFTIKPQGAGRSLHQPHLLQRWGHVHPATAAQSLSRASEREAQKGEGERQERRADTAEEEEKEKQEDDEEGQEEEAESSSEPPPTLEAKSRTKRFVSEDRFVEMLLVADASMVAFYGEDLESHILMLMSMAARIYKHPSIGNSVNLVMIKLVIMGDEKLGPEVSDNSGLILRDFCAWQRDVNQPRDRHPEHFDTAVLLTRENLCGQEGRCDTLGVANVGTICEPSKSCAVIQDQGLQAAYTLAHELGHVLGMPHDDSKLCTRLFGPLDKHHMMAPLYVQLNKTRPWSPCSASFLREFLDRGYGDCLLDAPSWAMALPTDLPGRRALYDLDQQCKQIFGLGFRHCPNSSDQNTCAQLWCRIDGPDPLCHTRNASLPWADGTPCGPGHLCWEGSCLPKEEVEKPEAVVDGGWAPWGPWGACSRTCGGGVQFSYRECTNPEPQNGGKYCLGQRAKYQSCHTEECPPDGKSFREQQCEKFNAYNYTDVEGNLLQWVPKYAGVSPRDRCKLFCLARGRSEFRMFEDKVIDGTLCGPDTLAICVRGQCVKAGCDHVLDSPKKLDKCGVCGGKGDSCRKVSGSFSPSRVVVRGQEVGEHMAQSDRQRGRRRPRAQGCIIFESVSSRSALSNWDPYQKQLLQAYCGEDISPVPGGSCPFCSYGYNDIVTFPAGSTNIDVKQRSPPGVQNDGNYLALKTTDGEYLLNGNNAIFPTEQYILLNGTVLRYSGAFTSLERLQSFQSLPQPLTLQLLKVHGDPLKVKYTFFVPDDVYSSKQSSRERTTTNVIQALLSTQWVLGAWSECSHSCGAGWQRRAVQCRDPSGQTSAACDEALKPEDTKLCRSLPCFS